MCASCLAAADGDGDGEDDAHSGSAAVAARLHPSAQLGVKSHRFKDGSAPCVGT